VARELQCVARMSPIEDAFQDLQDRLIELDRGWTCEESRAGLRFLWADVNHHVCGALAFIEDTAEDRRLLAPHKAYEALDAASRVLAREAFLGVVALGQFLRRGSLERLAAPSELEAAERANASLLEELMPFVSRADGVLRALTLEEACGG